MLFPRSQFNLAFAAVLINISFTSTLTAEEVSSTMSYQGYSGIINTPTANLFKEGTIHLQYGNQVETHREYHGGNKEIQTGYRSGQNYNAAVGLWKYVEVSTRLADYTFEDEKYITDLSANIKLGIPYIPEDWFKLAIGIQDVGGARSFFDAKYAVASKTVFDDFNVSLGLGTSESLQGRLDGVFAGIEWQPYSWLKLSTEYDAADVQVAMHLASPKSWLYNDIQLTSDILLSSSNEDLQDEFYYGVGLTIPLNLNNSSSSSPSKSKVYESQFDAKSLDSSELKLTAAQERKKVQNLLVEEGFEYIEVAESDSQTLFIAIQDHVYNRDNIDGLGVALGIIASNVHFNYARFELVLKERQIPTMIVKGDIAEYVAFLRDNKPLKLAISTDTFSHSTPKNHYTSEDSNNFWLKPRLTFWPGVVSRVGTELGVFDASLALISHLELPLWHGAAVTAQHTYQAAETKHFEDGEYYADDKQESGLHDYSFHQAFSLPFSIKNMTSVGVSRADYNFVSNEIKWQSTDGGHSINLLTSRYELQEVEELKPYPNCNILFSACWPDPEPEERDVYVAKYRYYNAFFNASTELQVGQYWQQDRGVRFKMERMFGDVSLNLTYKNTKVDEGDRNQLIGLGFSIPLTPRKDYNHKYFQVRGKPKWNYSLNTLVGEETNDLTPGTGDSARQFYNIDSVYYNHDKFGADYVYGNSQRLKQASYEVF